MNERIEQLDPSVARQIIEPFGETPAVPVDALIATLDHFCIHHKLPFSKARALRGIPHENSTLSPHQYGRAAENLGLKVKPVKTKPSAVSVLVYPCLIYFKDGSTGILRSKSKKGRLTVTVFDQSGVELDRLFTQKECDRSALDVVNLVTVLPEAEAKAEATKGTAKHWFWSTVRNFWPSWTYVVFATFFINLLGLALPLFVMNVYDRVIPNNSISTLWALVAGISIALVFDLILKVLRTSMIDNSGKRIDMTVSSRIFEHALDVRMEQQPKRSGELANHIREFESVRDFFSSGAIASIIDLLFVGVFLGFLYFIVGELALVPLLAVPVVLFAALVVQIPLGWSIRASQNASGNRHSVLVESVVGIETVKSIAAEGALQKRWDSSVAAAARAGASTRFWSSLAINFTMFAQQLVSVVVITWGVFLVAAGDITIGALVAANILAGRILAPLGGISATLVRAQQAFSALANLNAIMKLDRDNPKFAGKGTTVDSGGLEFRDVEFSYPDQLTPALNGASIKITQGERVGIIGRVGSGKSTIGKLVSGLYSPASGGVLVDGTDTRHLDSAELRGRAIYVNQEAELFAGTIRENVLLANPDPGKKLDHCLNAAGVTAFASRHPLGLEMQVGERGKLLSGGQRQAVAIARAMVAEPKILFLDEPTAHMDTVSEASFIKSFRSWLSPSTTLLIATHRSTLLDIVDRLIVIEDGKIVADGPKARILKQINAGLGNTRKSGGKDASN